MSNKDRFLAGHIFKGQSQAPYIYRFQLNTGCIGRIEEQTSYFPSPAWKATEIAIAHQDFIEIPMIILGTGQAIRREYEQLIFIDQQEGGSDV